MDNQLQIFSNPDFGDIRVIERLDETPLFVGKDIATALGYAEPAKAVRELVPDKFKGVSEMDTPGGKQKVIVITEAGVYKLIFRSKLPNAEKFSDWVCEDVLPSIRKHGYFSAETIQAATDTTVLTDFERGKELAKLAFAAQRGYIREVLIAKAANLLSGENLFDLDSIGGTKTLTDKIADKKDHDDYTFEPALFELSNDIQPARYAFTLGKWKRKK